MSIVSKINDNMPVAIPKQAPKADTDFFKKALIQAIDQKNGSEATQDATEFPTDSLGEIRPSAIPPLNIAQPPSQKRIETGMQHLLEQLDTYTRELDDSGKSLKDMASLIADIKTTAQELIQETDTDEPLNGSLKDIATEFAVTANVEYLKFFRGDYV